MENQIILTGNLYKINDTEQVSDKFRKRSAILEIPGKYPDYPTVEFTQDKCDLLDGYSVGQEVKVSINIKGRLYQDKNTGEQKSFNTIQAWRIESAGTAQAPEDTQAGEHSWAQAEAVTQNGEEDDLPF